MQKNSSKQLQNNIDTNTIHNLAAENNSTWVDMPLKSFTQSFHHDVTPLQKIFLYKDKNTPFFWDPKWILDWTLSGILELGNEK